MSTASAVSAERLTKRYGRRRGVQDVSFTVEPEQVCALLGPNGAGKTTTMRMLVGLSRADSGCARLLGRPSRLAADVLASVGVLIDGPAFVPHLSGWRNLELLWRAGGRAWPPPALEASLALAGLGSALHRRVKSYSMGMRQRLTLAQALMGAPQVLVLDEPANGLDPGEVRALRDLPGVDAIEEQDGRLVVTAPQLSAQQLTSRLVAAGVGVSGLRAARRLEDVFLGLVTGGEDGAAR